MRATACLLLFAINYCCIVTWAIADFQNGTEIRNERQLLIEDIPEYEVLPFPGIAISRKVAVSTKKPKQTSSSTPAPASGPCSCISGICTCCTGPILDLLRQKACVKIIYSPEDFAFDVSMLVNNRVMYQNKVSGKNPPPACIRMPRISSLKLCAKFSNIYFAGRNIHMCLGMEGRWDYYELFSISLDCLRMGSEGFAVVKPEEGGGGLPGVVGGVDAVIDSGGDDIGDYDENVVRSFVHKIIKKRSGKDIHVNNNTNFIPNE